MKPVIVFGSDGPVGAAAVRALQARGPVEAVPMRGADGCVLLDPERLAEIAARGDRSVFIADPRLRTARLAQGSPMAVHQLLADHVRVAAAHHEKIIRIAPTFREGTRLAKLDHEIRDALGPRAVDLRAPWLLTGTSDVERALYQLAKTGSFPVPMDREPVYELCDAEDLGRALAAAVYDGPRVLRGKAVGLRQILRAWTGEEVPLALGRSVAEVQYAIQADLGETAGSARFLAESMFAMSVDDDADPAWGGHLIEPHQERPPRPWYRERVRSVQLLDVPPDMTASRLGKDYWDWMRRFGLRTRQTAARVTVALPGGIKLLDMVRRKDLPEHAVGWRVVGGMLAAKPQRGWFEFRVLENGGAVVALHDFGPALPWGVYRSTQATVHDAVMRAYQRSRQRRLDVTPTA